VLRVGHQLRVCAIHQIHRRHLEPIRIAPAVLLPRGHTDGTCEGLLEAGWHLNDHVSTFASLFPQFVILLVGEVECNLTGAALDQHVEDVAILQRLRTSCPATELNHRLVAVTKGETWKLATPTIAIEETDVPSLAEGEGHQDLVHGSGSFPWKLGLQGGVLSGSESDEACPDAPAANTGFELLPLVDADFESAQKLPYFIQCRVGEVAAKRRAEILLQKLNKPEVAVVGCVEIYAMRHATLDAKPLGHRMRRRERDTAEAADPPLLPHPRRQLPFVGHGWIVGEDKAKAKRLVVDDIWTTRDCVISLEN
jgi:hypothetical protein